MSETTHPTARGHRLRWLQIAIGLGVAISMVTLIWLGYHAVGEWQRSTALLAQRRAEAAADLLVLAITRDMRGVQGSVLSSLRFEDAGAEQPLDINGVSSAFARYPYPEVFFAGRGTPATESTTFYSRTERSPSWLPAPDHPTRFPVRLGRAPQISDVLHLRIAPDVTAGKRFSTFDVTVNRRDYQVVALLTYADPARQTVQGIVGFMVSLDWVRERYFDELVTQVIRLQGGADASFSLAVIDPQGLQVAGDRLDATGAGPSSRRAFPLLFFDPVLVALDSPPDLRQQSWSVGAATSGDSSLLASRLGARQTVSIAAVSALVLIAGTVFAIRAARMNMRLMAMRSDFVSAVTHELRTPIATIRAVSETVASGRSSDPRLAREYAQLAVHETKRLTRLIDNLLAYARITDVTEMYAFEPMALGTLTTETLKEFDSQLVMAKFTVTVDIPRDLPWVRADRGAMILALGNVIDNAIRYSNGTRRLVVAARRSADAVALDVRDAGRGIPANEMPHVTRKFFRGRDTTSGGSGLGLSIVQRIVSDHGGTLTIQSDVGVGTNVTISLPSAEVPNNAETDFGR